MEVAALALRFSLGWLVLVVGLTKLTNVHQFEEAVRRYALLPGSSVRPVARLLVGFEVSYGLLMLAGVGTAIVAMLLAALLGGYAAAMAANLLRGRRTECGCGTAPRMISWLLVARNATLVAAALIVASGSPQVLSVDPFTAVGTSEIRNSDAVAIAVIATVVLPLCAAMAEGLRLWRLRTNFTAAKALP